MSIQLPAPTTSGSPDRGKHAWNHGKKTAGTSTEEITKKNLKSHQTSKKKAGILPYFEVLQAKAKGGPACSALAGTKSAKAGDGSAHVDAGQPQRPGWPTSRSQGYK